MLSFDYMLTKRTNILFDQKTWDYLVGLSQTENTSVGDLVRKAVKIVYNQKEVELKKQREEAHAKVLKLRRSMKHTFTTAEIIESVHQGRKYE